MVLVIIVLQDLPYFQIAFLTMFSFTALALLAYENGYKTKTENSLRKTWNRPLKNKNCMVCFSAEVHFQIAHPSVKNQSTGDFLAQPPLGTLLS